jgi:hypothetical protein
MMPEGGTIRFWQSPSGDMAAFSGGSESGRLEAKAADLDLDLEIGFEI